jgi:hypothetical protein
MHVAHEMIYTTSTPKVRKSNHILVLNAVGAQATNNSAGITNGESTQIDDGLKA